MHSVAPTYYSPANTPFHFLLNRKINRNKIDKKLTGKFLITNKNSSLARGRAGGLQPPSPPIGLSTKMQNKQNTTFLALLRLFFALEWTTK